MSQDIIVKQGTSLTPKQVAEGIFLRISELEKAVAQSENQVANIEKRGAIKSLFSSTKTDLINISKSQNKINDAMLEVVNEAIALNVTSYSFLAAVIEQLEQRVTHGMHDSNGRIIKLSDVGRGFANSAASIFNKILEGSRETKETLAQSAERIEQVDRALQETEAQMQKQAMQLSSVQAAMDILRAMDEERAQQIAQLQHQSTDHAAVAGRHASELVDLRSLGGAQALHFAELSQAAEARAIRIQGLEQKLAELSSRHEDLQQGHHVATSDLGVLTQRLRMVQRVAIGSMVLGLAALVAIVSKMLNVF